MPTVSNALMDLLKSMRHGDNAEPRRRRSKVNVQAGKSLCVEDLVDDPDSSSSEDNVPDFPSLNRAEDNVERMAEDLGNSTTAQQCVKINDFVIVWVPTTHNTQKYFVGEIKETSVSEFLVRFLRKQKNKFVWPQVLDESLVSLEQIAFVLSKPDVLKRGVRFQEKELEGFSLN